MTSQTPRNILLKEPIMATQTRRTTRRSARFCRATGKVSMVMACCGLVLWSAVATHAELPLNGLPMNGVPLNGFPTNGMPMNGLPLNGLYLNGVPMNGLSLQAPTLQQEPLPAVPQESLPWSTLSHRPLGEAAAPSMRDGRDIPPVALPEVR